MATNRMVLVLVSAAIAALLLSCGGSTEVGNARSEITGSIVDNGNPVDSAAVDLVAQNYIAGTTPDGSVFSTRTAADGSYRLSGIPDGSYYLGAKKAGKRLLRGPFEISGSADLAVDELKPVASMKVTPPAGFDARDIYVRGLAQTWTTSAGQAVFDSLPPGDITFVITRVLYSNKSNLLPKELMVSISSGESAVAAFNNAPPVIVTTGSDLTMAVAAVDSTWQFHISAYDPEGKALRYALQNGPLGMSMDSLTGTITWKTDSGSVGAYTPLVTVTDSNGAGRTIKVPAIAASAKYVVPFTTVVDTTVPDLIGMAGNPYLFIAGMLTPGKVGAYRFTWGDGDTTAWQSASYALHSWKTGGRYGVRFQAQYRSDGSLSAWSVPLWIGIDYTPDRVPPVISLRGPDSVRVEGTLSMADFMRIYKEPGYSATDNVDGDITGKVIISIDSLSNDSSWYRIYQVTDAAGNQGMTRRVIFKPVVPVDTAPQVQLRDDDTVFCIDSIGVGEFMSQFAGNLISAVSGSTGMRSYDSVTIAFDTLDFSQGTVIYRIWDPAGTPQTQVRLVFLTCVNAKALDLKLLLRGGVYTEIYAGSGWLEPGYAAYDANDSNLTGDVKVDTAGFDAKLATPNTTCRLYYWVTNRFRHTVVAARTFRVIGSAISGDSVRITINGGNPDTFWLWEKPDSIGYVDRGVTATDPVLGTISSQVVRTGTVDINKPGTYSLTYSVRGSDSMLVSATRTVEVMVPPDDISGMRAKYGVPMNGPLPPVNGSFYLEGLDGDSLIPTPDLGGLEMAWDSAGKKLSNLRMYLITGTDTLDAICTYRLHTFDTRQPAFDLYTSVSGKLNGQYLVGIDAARMYWVAFDGRMVFIWRRV